MRRPNRGVKMTMLTKHAFVALAVLVAMAIPLKRIRAESTPTKVPVRTLDIGNRLDSVKLRARVNLVPGDAIDFEVSDRDREAFFNIAKVLAGGRAKLSVELEDGKVAGLEISVPWRGDEIRPQLISVIG